MLDRKKPPKYKTIQQFNITRAQKHFLNNGITLYTINAGEQDVLKINFFFKAGNIYSENIIVAEAANAMLNEGTKKYSSAQIAEKIDFYGAYQGLHTGKYSAGIILYSLNKHLQKTLEIVKQMIIEPVFPQKEIDTYLLNEIQAYNIDREKTDVIASEEFYKTIFGKNHLYAKIPELDNYKNVDRQMIVNFYEKHYNMADLIIVAAGKINDTTVEIINNTFGFEKILNRKINENFDTSIKNIKPQKLFIPKADAQQASLRVGKITVGKKHPDYFKLSFVNTILGGYFGSRLMQNIREDKAYTYGIYSSTVAFRDTGFLVISAETGNDVYEKTVSEIFKELKILRTKKISLNELSLVKNYLNAKFLSGFDGAFALSASFISMLEHNLDYNYFQNWFNTVSQITPDDIIETSKNYLQEDSMSVVISGKE